MPDKAWLDFATTHLAAAEVRGKAVIEVGPFFNPDDSLRRHLETLGPASYLAAAARAGEKVDEAIDPDGLLDRYGPASFDLLICAELLQHIPDWQRFVANLKKITRPGGLILLAARSRGAGFQGRPYDLWRCEVPDIAEIFADCELEVIMKDPGQPGVFARARKPQNFREKDLSNFALFSLIKGRRVPGVSPEDLEQFNTFLQNAGLEKSLSELEALAGAHTRSRQREEVLSAENQRRAEALKLLEDQFRQREEERLKLRQELQKLRFSLERLGRDTARSEIENENLGGIIEDLNRQLKAKDAVIQRLESDLRALQATRTVRLSRAAGIFTRGTLQLARGLTHPGIEGTLDAPAEGAEIREKLLVSGWAASNTGWITRVEVWLDKAGLGQVPYGLERPDVAARRPLQVGAGCGFEGELDLDLSLFNPGPKTFKVVVTDSRGHTAEFSRRLTIRKTPFRSKSPWATPPDDYEKWLAVNEPHPAELKKQAGESGRFEYRPLISLLALGFNSPPEPLRATIESVLNQTYGRWELCLAVPSTKAGKAGFDLPLPAGQEFPPGGDVPARNRPAGGPPGTAAGGPAPGSPGEPGLLLALQEYARQDPRIKLQFLPDSPETASNWNAALAAAAGEFIALLEPGDELAPGALFENVRLLNRQPEAAIIYSDEDKLDPSGRRCRPAFKPDWSPDLLQSEIYTGQLGLYRASLVKEVGGFRPGFEGLQNYDLLLRLVEKTAEIYHIPKILYHSRLDESRLDEASNLSSFAGQLQDNKEQTPKAQLKAVEEHLQRLGLAARAEVGMVPDTVRVRYEIRENPCASIIIPTRDQLGLLRQCLESLRSLTTYPHYELLVVDNNSQEAETLRYFEELKSQPRTKVLSYPHEFNFSAINNFAARQAAGELLLFLNNDIEVISPGWLEAMVEQAQRPEVGAVGARLLYPNGTLQHAGVIIGISGQAGHSHKYWPAEEPGYLNRASVIQNFSAVTGACLMTRAGLFRSLEGFNEDNLPVAFNDVDYCLRVREKGLLVTWTPFAELVHHESISRGQDDTAEKMHRFQREVQYMRRRWSQVIQHDPYYNPNLTVEAEDFSIAAFSRVQA